MGRLDEFFKSLKGQGKRSELEVLEDIESALGMGDIERALELTEELESEPNLFLALRMIMRSMREKLQGAGEKEDSGEPERMRASLKELIPLVNSLSNPHYRALLLGDLAVLFYLLNDEFNGDPAVKTAINLAGDRADIIRDVLMILINSNLLKKAGYAMKLVRDPEKLDVVLAHLAEIFYREGDVEKVAPILDHISSPFHRAMALYYMAQIESERDRDTALKILTAAFKVAEKIEDSETRFEVMLKLYDLKNSLLGQSLSLKDLLSGKEAPPQ